MEITVDSGVYSDTSRRDGGLFVALFLDGGSFLVAYGRIR